MTEVESVSFPTTVELSTNGSVVNTEEADFNPLVTNDYMAEYAATGSFYCTSCNQYSELIEDHKAGDQICRNCGAVATERLIAQDAEYRVFSEDSASYGKIRVGAAYNPLKEYSLTERSKLERDEKEFLWDGIKNIEDIFYRLSQGDSSNAPAQHRAKELFEQSFHIQVQQKKGAVPMKRSGDKKSGPLKNQARQKFSRRKQFVISAVYQALLECGIIQEDGKKPADIEKQKDKWIQDLSNQLDGIDVSKYSVRNCLKDLKLKYQ